MQNKLEGTYILMSSADRVAHIDGHHALLGSNTHYASSGV